MVPREISQLFAKKPSTGGFWSFGCENRCPETDMRDAGF
jgi:hypothetical protein